MAKRNRDDQRGRETRGGLRNTEAVRGASYRNARSAEASRFNLDLSRYDVELDLSAFEANEPGLTTFERMGVARTQDIARPGRTISMQNRKRPEGSERDTQRRPARKIAQAESRLAQSGGLAESRAARTDHLQAEPSDKRKERSRPNCKQRPEPTKGSGSTSRKFVPWCDRKR